MAEAHDSDKAPRFSAVAVDEKGNPIVCCEMCGSIDIELDGWDIDKCWDCGHWRYR